jgi:hypothetical protein
MNTTAATTKWRRRIFIEGTENSRGSMKKPVVRMMSRLRDMSE